MHEHRKYVSRGGEKLAAALRAFELDVAGWTCVDLGSHAGGFVDCLLQHGAARVYAVEPGFGVLDYSLRRDPRVVVCERTNALTFAAPEPADLVTIDVGWTMQRLVLPAARRCLRPGGRIVSLVKPQYEGPAAWRPGGVLMPERRAAVLEGCRSDAAAAGLRVQREVESPLRGQGGNVEYLWLLGAAGP